MNMAVITHALPFVELVIKGSVFVPSVVVVGFKGAKTEIIYHHCSQFITTLIMICI